MNLLSILSVFKFKLPAWLLLLSVTIMGVYIGYLKYTVKDLETDNEKHKHEVFVCQLQVKELNAVIESEKLNKQNVSNELKLVNSMLSECYKSSQEFNAGITEIDNIMNSETVCEPVTCQCDNTVVQPEKVVSKETNKKGIEFLNKHSNF